MGYVSRSYTIGRETGLTGEQDYGAQLKAFRARTQMKQDAAAEQLGVSQAYVSRLENGSISPSSEIADRLSALLTTPENRDHFAHWRSAIRQCRGYSTLACLDSGKVRLTEISRGLRDLGAPFSGFTPGELLQDRLGPDADRRMRVIRESGIFEGAVCRLEDAWRATIGGALHHFQVVTSPVRDDFGAWYVFSCHFPMDQTAYAAWTARPDTPVIHRDPQAGGATVFE